MSLYEKEKKALKAVENKTLRVAEDDTALADTELTTATVCYKYPSTTTVPGTRLVPVANPDLHISGCPIIQTLE